MSKSIHKILSQQELENENDDQFLAWINISAFLIMLSIKYNRETKRLKIAMSKKMNMWYQIAESENESLKISIVVRRLRLLESTTYKYLQSFYKRTKRKN